MNSFRRCNMCMSPLDGGASMGMSMPPISSSISRASASDIVSLSSVTVLLTAGVSASSLSRGSVCSTVTDVAFAVGASSLRGSSESVRSGGCGASCRLRRRRTITAVAKSNAPTNMSTIVRVSGRRMRMMIVLSSLLDMPVPVSVEDGAVSSAASGCASASAQLSRACGTNTCNMMQITVIMYVRLILEIRIRYVCLLKTNAALRAEFMRRKIKMPADQSSAGIALRSQLDGCCEVGLSATSTRRARTASPQSSIR